jgi:hypothetical protein
VKILLPGFKAVSEKRFKIIKNDLLSWPFTRALVSNPGNVENLKAPFGSLIGMVRGGIILKQSGPLASGVCGGSSRSCTSDGALIQFGDSGECTRSSRPVDIDGKPTGNLPEARSRKLERHILHRG